MKVYEVGFYLFGTGIFLVVATVCAPCPSEALRLAFGLTRPCDVEMLEIVREWEA